MKSVERTIEILESYRNEIPAAHILALALQEYGYFHGIMLDGNGGWYLKPFPDIAYPMCHVPDTSNPADRWRFSAVLMDNDIWWCEICKERKQILMDFSIRTGEKVKELVINR